MLALAVVVDTATAHQVVAVAAVLATAVVSRKSLR
jgi:hypothetical protein